MLFRIWVLGNVKSYPYYWLGSEEYLYVIERSNIIDLELRRGKNSYYQGFKQVNMALVIFYYC